MGCKHENKSGLLAVLLFLLYHLYHFALSPVLARLQLVQVGWYS